MSPEELNELRKSAEMVQCIGIQNAAVCRHPYNGVNNASFALVNLPDLLAHIDSQAAQIETLKEDIEVMKLGEKAADGLILQGRKYAEQIEALKEKLVEQLAKYFVLQQAQCTFRTPIKGSMMSKCDKGVICDWNVCPIKDEWEEQARQQLAQEMPEVEWDV